MISRITLILLVTLVFSDPVSAQASGEFEIARAKYRGGGDWYNDPSALQNLILFAKANVPIPISESYKDVSLGSAELHSYPFIFLTGHGNITLNSAEANNLREYLENGGFLYIDDDYGLDKYIRPVIKQVFPNEEFVEIPFNHPIYDQVFEFGSGLPKIHEHDNKPPQGFGIFHEGRLVVFYSYESNLGDGWTDAEVHNTPESLRQKALQMGLNVLVYALTRN
ncbi:MAG: DUF4159 domain-containing protein [Gracilimonas sp.]|uniref:DUF4159 domain-containing protein n=1 Tax=Gracilimonas sp. TaxID=1974203 RepID=UPI0019BE551C|nr:DUF4159 domain-containing protein [Gracilimonas sp.]MBD3615349.1 DUF4159 domain-containing protein [Gracilimonas sp.]